MTLEEAIRHAEEKAKCGGKCGEDHAQLAEWLKELQERRVAAPGKRTNERTETHACDCISRKAALDCVSNSLVAWEAYEAIEALPSAQQWIPCSERLPEESGLYIVTNVGRWVEPVGTRYYNIRADGGFWSGHPGNKVLAWMPLPEPYGGEQNGSD